MTRARLPRISQTKRSPLSEARLPRISQTKRATSLLHYLPNLVPIRTPPTAAASGVRSGPKLTPTWEGGESSSNSRDDGSKDPGERWADSRSDRNTTHSNLSRGTSEVTHDVILLQNFDKGEASHVEHQRIADHTLEYFKFLDAYCFTFPRSWH